MVRPITPLWVEPTLGGMGEHRYPLRPGRLDKIGPEQLQGFRTG
jgi:hypothetical protein